MSRFIKLYSHDIVYHWDLGGICGVHVFAAARVSHIAPAICDRAIYWARRNRHHCTARKFTDFCRSQTPPRCYNRAGRGHSGTICAPAPGGGNVHRARTVAR